VENVKAQPACFDVVVALNILPLIDDPVAAVNKVSA
jgi:hypothetical protein